MSKRTSARRPNSIRILINKWTGHMCAARKWKSAHRRMNHAQCHPKARWYRSTIRKIRPYIRWRHAPFKACCRHRYWACCRVQSSNSICTTSVDTVNPITMFWDELVAMLICLSVANAMPIDWPNISPKHPALLNRKWYVWTFECFNGADSWFFGFFWQIWTSELCRTIHTAQNIPGVHAPVKDLNEINAVSSSSWCWGIGLFLIRFFFELLRAFAKDSPTKKFKNVFHKSLRGVIKTNWNTVIRTANRIWICCNASIVLCRPFSHKVMY